MNFRFQLIKKIDNTARLAAQLGGAAARGLTSTAQAVVAEAKQLVNNYFSGSPYSTGALEQSITVQKSSYVGGYEAGGGDYGLASVPSLDDSDDLLDGLVEDVLETPDGTMALIAGSWLPYACVVEVGRKMAYMEPSVELVAGTTADSMFWSAFNEMRTGTGF